MSDKNSVRRPSTVEPPPSPRRAEVPGVLAGHAVEYADSIPQRAQGVHERASQEALEAQSVATLSGLGVDVISRVTDFLRRDGVAALAGTSRALQAAVTEHPPTAAVLNAWSTRERELAAMEEMESELAVSTWNRQVIGVTEPLVAADARRRGRNAASWDDREIAVFEIQLAHSKAIAALIKIDADIDTRVAEAAEALAGMEAHIAILHSRCEDPDAVCAELLRRFVHTTGKLASDMTVELLAASLPAIDPAKVPPRLRAVLGAIGRALEKRSQLPTAIESTRRAVHEMLRGLSRRDDDPETRMARANLRVSSMRPFMELFTETEEERAFLRVFADAVDEMSPDRIAALQAGVDEIRRQGPSRPLDGILGMLESILEEKMGPLSAASATLRPPLRETFLSVRPNETPAAADVPAALRAAHGLFASLLDELSETVGGIAAVLKRATSIVPGTIPIVATITAAGLDPDSLLRPQLRLAIGRMPIERIDALRANLAAIDGSGPDELESLLVELEDALTLA